jgi:hypothetical protein
MKSFLDQSEYPAANDLLRLQGAALRGSVYQATGELVALPQIHGNCIEQHKALSAHVCELRARLYPGATATAPADEVTTTPVRKTADELVAERKAAQSASRTNASETTATLLADIKAGRKTVGEAIAQAKPQPAPTAKVSGSRRQRATWQETHDRLAQLRSEAAERAAADDPEIGVAAMEKEIAALEQSLSR